MVNKDDDVKIKRQLNQKCSKSKKRKRKTQWASPEKDVTPLLRILKEISRVVE